MRVQLLNDNYVVKKVWHFATIAEAMEFLGVRSRVLLTGMYRINGSLYALYED